MRARLAACPDVDSLYIKDPGGLLQPQRARTLIPAIKAVIGDKPLELHSHCTIGLAELGYMDAPGYGVSALQCALGRRGGWHLEPAIRAASIANLRALGHSVDVDDEALAQVNAYFTTLADSEGLPAGSPQAFDAAYLRHQLPGGVVSTMRRHLREVRQSHIEGSGDRGAGPGARGAGLADRDDALRADDPDAGGDERHRQGALRDDSRTR